MLAKLHWFLSTAREFPGFRDLVRDLRREASLSPAEWRERQAERLRRLLCFAGTRVPYYRQIFGEAGIDLRGADLLEQLARLPLLTRRLVVDHQADLVADGLDRAHLYTNATGGSTGEPVSFYQDHEYRKTALALDSFVRSWWGIRPYDRTASIWGADREFSELSWRERFHQWRHRTRTLNAFRMEAVGLRRFCRMIARWRPPYLTGYATALEAFAHCVEAEGLPDLQLRAIRSAAETLWPYQRELIERVLRCPVYDFYGTREVNNLAAECPEQRRLHLISTWRYLEIVNEHGQPVSDGTPGYVAVTDLSNWAMPFIRYRNDDMAVLATEPCPCGRPSAVIEKLLGRTSDIIHSPRGEWIHGEYFTHLFYGRPEIRKFQVHQTALDRIVIRYVPGSGDCEVAMRAVVEKVRQRMGEEMRIELERCEKIPVSLSGKYRFTISDLSSTMREPLI